MKTKALGSGDDLSSSGIIDILCDSGDADHTRNSIAGTSTPKSRLENDDHRLLPYRLFHPARLYQPYASKLAYCLGNSGGKFSTNSRVIFDFTRLANYLPGFS